MEIPVIILLVFLAINIGLIVVVVVTSKRSCIKLGYRMVSDSGMVSDHNMVTDQEVASSHKMVTDQKLISDHQMVTDQEVVSDYKSVLDEKPEFRIAGGADASIEDNPFIAAVIVKKHGLLFKEMLQCSCVIISKKCVITAAHCIYLLVDQGFEKHLIIIRSNSEEWREGNAHDVEEWTYHDRYDEAVRQNDIGLMQVKQSFNGKFENSIPIAKKGYPYQPDTEVKVAGWGWWQEELHELLPSLNEVYVTIFEQSYCESLYKTEGFKITGSMFCAGDLEGDKGACSFDLGGPVVENGILVGIVSWGIGCGRKYLPAVYTRVALYQDWITRKRKQWNC